MFDQIGANAQLIEHSAEFTKSEIVKVVDKVHVAIGFDLANSVLIEGDRGSIVIDTLGSVEAADDVLAAYREITDQPIQAIIYTHNHTDHIMGAGVFADESQPDIYAHERLPHLVSRIFNVLRPIIAKRSMRQFGVYLTEGGLVNAGIGPRLRTNHESNLAYRPPTHTFSDHLSILVAGVPLELIHAPGETDDATYVWLPKKRCLISADNIYKTFPNLYAIRGTAYRDVMQWVASLDMIRDLRPEHLVPMHGRPMHGADEIYATVTAYRDAIQFVHDQTIRLINRGFSAEQIAAQLTLPPHLANHRYLREHYGTLGWSARAIFEGYLGWFSGNPSDLEPLAPSERAERMAAMVGGSYRLKQQAEQAAAAGDYQWVLELTDHLQQLRPSDWEIRKLRSDALIALGERHSSANGRNYFLTSAQELNGFKMPSIVPKAELLPTFPIDDFFQAMRVRLNPEKSVDKDIRIGFNFIDSGRSFILHVRYGVLEVREVSAETTTEKPDATLTTHEQVWKEIAARLRKPMRAVLSRQLKINGSVPQLLRFLQLFET